MHMEGGGKGKAKAQKQTTLSAVQQALGLHMDTDRHIREGAGNSKCRRTLCLRREAHTEN
jgi:hypothetical protein